MLRKTVRAAVMAVGLAAGAFTLQVVAADDVPSIHDIMEEGHSGKKSYMAKVVAAVKDGKLDDAAAPAKKLAANGAALGKNKPEKGDAASWKKLSELYAEQTAAVSAAAGKKDAAATTAALDALKKSCKACHDAHQPD